MSAEDRAEEVVAVRPEDFLAFLQVAEGLERADEFTDLWFGNYEEWFGSESEAHWALVEMMTGLCKARPDLRERLDRVAWDYPPGRFMNDSNLQPVEIHEKDVEMEAAAVAASKPPRKVGAASQSSKPERRVKSAAELMAMQFPETAWAVRGLIPEGLSVLAGKPKLGKSWLALQLAVAVASGTPALGNLAVGQGSVLYMALEDTDKRLQDRMRKVLGGAPVPSGFDYDTEWSRMNLGGRGRLKKWLEAQEDPRLVVVDTFACVRSGSTNASNPYDDDYRTTQEFKQLADAFGVAIVLVHHVRKMGADDPFDTVAGTVGLTGAADAILLLQRERNRNYGKLAVTGRDVEELALDLQWSPQGSLWSVHRGPVEPQVSEERQSILGLLARASGPLGPKSVAASLEREYNSVKQLMWQMAQDGQLARVGRKYAPPNNLDNLTNLSEHSTSDSDDFALYDDASDEEGE